MQGKMTFTDDDLRLFKEALSDERDSCVSGDLARALIARLEAAEDFIVGRNTIDADLKFEAWRKAAGK